MLNTFLAVVKDSKIELIDSVNFPEGTKLLVTPIPDSINSDNQDWHAFSLQGLEKAYDDAEPEYSLSSIKEFNPEYEGK